MQVGVSTMSLQDLDLQVTRPPAVAAQILHGARGAGLPLLAKLDEQIARGNVFAGTPDQVFAQIKSFLEYSGGFGHLLMMEQAGFLTYDKTVASMQLFTEEVYPRLQELTASYDRGRMQGLRAQLPDKECTDLGGVRGGICALNRDLSQILLRGS